MYVLEHGYRWLVRLDGSFWSAPFFYPAPNVIAYSDNHLGSFLFYSVFRILGAGRETAFQLWIISIFALNYFVTYFALKRQKFHLIGATAGAYLFTFSLVMAVQLGHIQLAPRFMVPVAFWMAYVFVESGSIKSFVLLLAACAYQIYLGIYVGYFLILSLGLFFVVLFIHRSRLRAIRSFIATRGVRNFCLKALGYASVCIGFVLVLVPLILPYYRAQQESGGRAWEEVAPMLPRWQSYLYGPESILWGRIMHFGDHLPMEQEHHIFFGFIPYFAILVFLYLFLRKRLPLSERPLGIAMMSVLLGIGVLTFCWRGFSLYHYVWTYLPGAGGIRAVTRIILVLMYPAAWILAATVSYFMDQQLVVRAHWIAGFAGMSILTLVVADQDASVASMSKRESKTRVARLKATVGHPKGSILWVSNRRGEFFIYRQLDAMLAAQDLGMNVVNGYSGLVPNNYPDSLFSLDGDLCTGIDVWTRLHPGAITSENLVQIGSICKIPDHDSLPVPVKGFSALEVGEKGGTPVHVWAINRSAEMSIPEMPAYQLSELLSFDLSTLNARSIKISQPDGEVETVSLAPGESRHVNLRVSASRVGNCLIRFETDNNGVRPDNGDPRTLFFDVSDPRLAPILRPN